jgi:hypothetical protein
VRSEDGRILESQGNVKSNIDLANGIVRPFKKWQIQRKTIWGYYMA